MMYRGKEGVFFQLCDFLFEKKDTATFTNKTVLLLYVVEFIRWVILLYKSQPWGSNSCNEWCYSLNGIVLWYCWLQIQRDYFCSNYFMVSLNCKTLNVISVYNHILRNIMAFFCDDFKLGRSETIAIYGQMIANSGFFATKWTSNKKGFPLLLKVNDIIQTLMVVLPVREGKFKAWLTLFPCSMQFRLRKKPQCTWYTLYERENIVDLLHEISCTQ